MRWWWQRHTRCSRWQETTRLVRVNPVAAVCRLQQCECFGCSSSSMLAAATAAAVRVAGAAAAVVMAAADWGGQQGASWQVTCYEVLATPHAPHPCLCVKTGSSQQVYASCVTVNPHTWILRVLCSVSAWQKVPPILAFCA